MAHRIKDLDPPRGEQPGSWEIEVVSEPFTTGSEEAMSGYLAQNRSDRHGRFAYSTDVLPVDVESLHLEFAPYRERFGLDIEALMAPR